MHCAVSLANTKHRLLSSEMKFSAYRWLIVLAIGIAGTHLTACGAEPSLTEEPSPMPVVSASDETDNTAPTVETVPSYAQIVEATSQPLPATGGALTGLEALKLALPLMRDWQADAHLLELGTTIMAPIAPDGTCTVWTASFYSASAKAMSGVIIQNGQGMVTAEIPTEYEVGRPIDFALVKLDSHAAMRIAAENGGGKYDAQDDILAVAVLNYDVASQKVVWAVNYQNQTDYTVVFSVHIDAVTSQVLR